MTEVLKDVGAAVRIMLARNGFAPSLMIVNGALLNRILKTSDYDPGIAYVVTKDRIEPFAEAISVDAAGPES